MKKWEGWWIPTPVTGKEKDNWGCYATKQTEKCSEIQCQDCIYWNLDGQAEWRLKEYLKEHKQIEEQARDSKGRFCKKEETESYYWEGLKVPVDPKREWGSWMCSKEFCPGVNVAECGGKGVTLGCPKCIYARCNYEARRCFYEQWYGKWPGFEEYFMGLRVPVSPKKEWTWLHNKGCCVAGGSIDAGCAGKCTCEKCIYFSFHIKEFEAFYKQHFCEKHELPKLTVEVFNRPDCPEWAQWAAVDEDGKAYWYSKKPEPKGTQWYRCAQNPGKYQQIENSTRTKFDPSDWEHSLIERPQKELPKLTQTAFHCPDCPKEATKLKVFPANHVVALDKDDKVLSVMELQCKEGEAEKPKEEWHYGWYYSPTRGLDYSRTGWVIPPLNACPVRVQYYKPEKLIGKAVTDEWGDWLIADVIYEASGHGTVYLKGLKEETIPVDIEDFIMSCRFTGTDLYCCKWEKLQ